MAARPCDSCKSAVALLFCRVDSVFLCMGCDAKIHRLGNARHERVWMCDVCEQAPASVKCKADAAALCVTCDRDIHSANPLSRRHERFPVAPFYDNAESVVKSAAATFLVPADDETTDFPEDKHFINIEVTANSCFTAAETTAPSWVIPNPTTKLAAAASEMKSIDLLLSESDQFLDFDYPITNHNPVADSVVPVQQTVQQLINQSSDNYTEIDFPGSKLNSCSNNNSYTARSLSQSFSSSSMDVLVPEVSSMPDISYPFRQTSNTGVAVGGPASTATDRVARVLRYREKRKNRKFEKTIRYASRKAYAETRPRIKGRFAKRAEVKPELVDEMFISGSSAYLAEAVEYGVVPTF